MRTNEKLQGSKPRWSPVRRSVLCCLLGAVYPASAILGVEQTIYPTADGTIVDGGGYGPFDGVGDTADWTFNGTNYEGAIALAHAPAPGFERRVICEYDLNGITAQPPVIATLTFRVRGSGLFPASAAGLHVFSYPADNLEHLGDFSRSPTIFVAEKSILPSQPLTLYEVNIGALIDEALENGTKKIAFRFQIDPSTALTSNQVFIDGALDSNPSTKPFIKVYAGIRGDFDHDSDVDVEDYALLAPCLAGPYQPATPACHSLDIDLDDDVDLHDVAEFLYAMATFGR